MKILLKTLAVVATLASSSLADDESSRVDFQNDLARFRCRIGKFPQFDVPLAGEHDTLHGSHSSIFRKAGVARAPIIQPGYGSVSLAVGTTKFRGKISKALLCCGPADIRRVYPRPRRRPDGACLLPSVNRISMSFLTIGLGIPLSIPSSSSVR